MLPEITLRGVIREDVDNVARWLADEEVASRWFGHYACGDPVHRGYDPAHMLEASESEWDRVFRHDPHRLIFSIYNEWEEHVGECQIQLADRSGAELSLLIGRKDLWHRGYGTSTAMAMLDQVFDYYRLDRAWVHIPEDNAPALGLFSKLGFVHEATRELCKRRDGTPFNACILAMDAQRFRARRSAEGRGELMPIVTVTGLPGSGSEALGAEVARLTGSRLIGDEIASRVSQRLRCSIGELEGLEDSYRSVWSRALTALIIPFERYGAYGGGNDWLGFAPYLDYDIPQQYLTKKRYLETLRGVITELAREGNAVFHGWASQVFMPDEIPAIRVFVSAPQVARQERTALDHSLAPEDARRWLRRMDREARSIYRHLYGVDLVDTRLYDLTLNLERLPFERAAQIVVKALEALGARAPEEAEGRVM